MGRKSKFSYEVKEKSVLSYENGEASFDSIANKIGAGATTVKRWVMIYRSQGLDGLKEASHNKYWSKDVKISAVLDYLSGMGSLDTICKKYKISHSGLLNRWVMMYNNHIELKSSRLGGINNMIKARKTAFEERVEIVQFCIANSKNYGLTMDKFNVSYQQIYIWVRKYEEKGIDGLIDRRGKAKPENKLTELDRLKAENKILAAKNQELQMEIDVIKKLQEVERRYR